MTRLTTRFIRDSRDLVEHFDHGYLDAHGPAERLLAFSRSSAGSWRRRGRARARDRLWDRHPPACAHGEVRTAHGIDVSPEMVRVACRHAEVSPWRATIYLTSNGGYRWYRHLAPWLGLDTRHLSTDRFLSTREVETLIGSAELALQRLEHWRFIPQGDLPIGWGSVLRALDWVGGHLRIGYLRGGIAFSAVRTN